MVCFISRPPNRVRKLLCNLRTLKLRRVSLYLRFTHNRRDVRWISNIIPLKTWFYHFLNGLNSYSSTNMATGARWQDPIGLDTINTVVKTLIPAWSAHYSISTILDGQDILCCTATGAGKSAAFAIPGLVLNEYNAHPDAYPAGLPTRKRPIGVVITPTKGLANKIVHFSPPFYLLCSLLSRFSNCQNLMCLLSRTATKPWAKLERLGSVWRMWLRNVLDGRWSVWTRIWAAAISQSSKMICATWNVRMRKLVNLLMDMCSDEVSCPWE